MYALAMDGKVGADPAKITDSAALFQAIDLTFRQTYDAVFGNGLPINSSQPSPFQPDLGNVAAVRAVVVRAVDGQSLVVLLTSVQGVDQAIPVSDLLMVRAQNTGDQFTAIKILGVGRIEYLLAGNQSP